MSLRDEYQRAAVPQPLSAGPDILPCTAAQERFWFLDQMVPGDPALNVAFRWHVTGRVSTGALETAFRRTIARHEILRSRFLPDQGRPLQQVMPDAPFHLPEIDLRAMAPADQQARIEAIAIESAALPFDLTRPGLIRAVLIRLANDRAILAITAHHIVFDGWSIGVLGREIGAHAAAAEKGGQADLPDLALQYGDFALWQQEYFASPGFAADLAPWRARLAGMPYFEIPPDFPRPLTRSARSASIIADPGADFDARLRGGARARAMSPFAFGAGVLSAMLARFADTAEVVLGCQIAGRNALELEPLIGVFINNVVLRLNAAPETRLDDHLDHARRIVQEALIGQNVPFNRLVEIANPPRDPSRMPLVSVNFILQHVFMETARHGDFELSSAPSHTPGTTQDLNFMLIGRAGGWRMVLDYSTDLFDEATARELVALWQDAFRFAFDGAARPLGQMAGPARGADARADDSRQLTRIEQQLAAHPQVGAAVVLPYRDASGARRLHGFVTPRADAPLLPLENLPGLLALHLAGSADAAPDGISVLDRMPLDHAGRVAKARLPLAEASQNARPPPLAAPPASIQSRLAAIWAGLLGIDEVPPTASFFDLGGHSLLAVRMLAMVEQEFGHRPSLNAAYHLPDLNALAQYLAAQTAPSADGAIQPLGQAGRGIALIGINNAHAVDALTRAMPHPRPASMISLFDKTDALPASAGFTRIAADYARSLRAAQPHGPYALFGNCVHGNLAIEIARQLQAEGEDVAAVILKDVWAPDYALRVAASRASAIRARLHYLRVRLRLWRRGELSFAAFLGSFRRLRRSGLLDLGVRLGLMDRVMNTNLGHREEAFLNALTDARNAHQPAPYHGTVLHFVTRDSPQGRHFDPEMGWGRLITGQLLTRFIDELSLSPGRPDGIAEAAREIEAVLRPLDPHGGGRASAPDQDHDNAR